MELKRIIIVKKRKHWRYESAGRGIEIVIHTLGLSIILMVLISLRDAHFTHLIRIEWFQVEALQGWFFFNVTYFVDLFL